MKTNRYDAPHWRTEVQIVDDIYERGGFEMPVHYILSLTHECNLHCPFCFLDKVEGDRAMNTEDWLEVLSQLPSYARVILFGGEPLMFHDFERVFTAATESFKCSIVTNGTLLTPERVELFVSKNNFSDLNISIDSMNNWNRNFSNSDWANLLAGVKHYNDIRKKRKAPPKLGISVVILDETAEELHDVHRFAHQELQCDFVNYCLLNGGPMQLSDNMQPFGRLYEDVIPPLYNKWDIILEQIEKNRRYDREHGYVSYFRPKIIDVNLCQSTEKLRILNKPKFEKERFGTCKMPWADCRIHPDGNISACLSVPFGNFKQTPDLKTILTSSTTEHFKSELKDHGFYAQCNRCVFLYDKAFERTSVSSTDNTRRR
ncbi:MAG: radical SAM protein [Desulfobacterales bacterium]